MLSQASCFGADAARVLLSGCSPEPVASCAPGTGMGVAAQFLAPPSCLVICSWLSTERKW